ncbi:cytochrome c [Candidatus Binatia bacterium]|nr:cytochrome c [Candidatus Binatia bacterium]
MLLSLVLAIPAVGRSADAGSGPASNAPPSASSGDVARGRYLTHSVAMCIQCHTPRNADGTLDETRLFQGAAIPVESPFKGQEWAAQAPDIAGLGSFDEEDEMSVLTKGHRRDGHAPKPPMPPFRMSEEDARAVLAYLRSLAR